MNKKIIYWGAIQKILLSVCTVLCTVSLHAQQGAAVTGVIVDELGSPMPGATVQLQGTARGVITDSDGSFSINVPSLSESVLEVSFVGYETQVIAIGGRKVVAVQMKPQAAEMEEVTITAFGKQKKESVVASIQTLNTKELRVPSSNLTTALAGRMAGMISYQTSGEPGADNAQFFIRGVTTFGYKTSPLILIDGFEASTDDLARLLVDDIASFSILKDASATVLYGARGANGIILVTTKEGREGPPKINARVDVHIATPTKMVEMVDGVTYMRLYNKALTSRNPLVVPYYSEQKIQSTMRGENPMIYPNVDWYKMLFNNHTINKRVSLNVSGGGRIASYYVSGGYENENGLLKVDRLNNFNNNISINRFSLRNTNIVNLTKTTILETRLNGLFQRSVGPYVGASDIFAMVINGNPVDFPSVYEPDEAHRYTQHTLFGLTPNGGTNPYAQMVRGYSSNDNITMTITGTLKQDLNFVTEGLNAEARISINSVAAYSARRTYSPYYYSLETYDPITGYYRLYNLNPQSGSALLSDVQPSRDAELHYYYDARLNWARAFGKHNIGAMVVGMADELQSIAGNSTSIYETLPERNLNLSGRINYDYDSRYFFEFAFGYNGSEKFTGKQKFGFFPSFGGGWLVSNEKFWTSLKNLISLLKFKATYGFVGNDAIAGRAGRFFYLSNISIGSGGGYIWGENFTNGYGGYAIHRYANPDITWEQSEKINLGVELSLFKDEAVKFQVDVFQDLRSRIYMQRQNFPSTSGLETAIHGNAGKVKSKGIDISVDIQHSFPNQAWITGRANFTYATNRYLELDEKNYPDEYLKRKGSSINQSWALIAERLFVDQAEIDNSPKQDFGTYMAGDIKYKDMNNDGVINPNDQVAMGFPVGTPEIQYGFGLSGGYKGFDLSFFFQGNSRISFFINPSAIDPFTGRRNAMSIVARESWSESNPDVHAFWPRLSTYTINNNIQGSSWWLREGGFLRLKTVEAGYNLNKLSDRAGLSNCRIYFSAENLFYVSPFKYWDPEMGGSGLGYPPNRRFNIGVQIGF
ncbi:MAG: TonB-dependent receptor [Bacteroidales bacterium]|jgi:TonB-linked SusC/RagA family outer membrane protein|nr:TonB-dependent receptor [Bacteroidales bacterium]